MNQVKQEGPLIEARNLGRRIPQQEEWPFREIDLAIWPGDALLVLGATGSGKTLLLRALQLEPEVLLLEEPTAALDTTAAQSMEELIRRWRREGKRALVWVTHQSDQIKPMGKKSSPWNMAG